RSFRRTRGSILYFAFTVLLTGTSYATMFPKRQEQLRVANRTAFIHGCSKNRPADVEADFSGQFCSCCYSPSCDRQIPKNRRDETPASSHRGRNIAHAIPNRGDSKVEVRIGESE